MSTVIGFLVIVAVIWLIVTIVEEAIEEKQKNSGSLPSGTRPPVTQGQRTPPRDPGETFVVVSRTRQDEPPPPSSRPNPASSGPNPVNGHGFTRPTVTVNTSGWCSRYGRPIADCDCDRCRAATGKNGATR